LRMKNFTGGWVAECSCVQLVCRKLPVVGGRNARVHACESLRCGGRNMCCGGSHIYGRCMAQSGHASQPAPSCHFALGVCLHAIACSSIKHYAFQFCKTIGFKHYIISCSTSGRKGAHCNTIFSQYTLYLQATLRPFFCDPLDHTHLFDTNCNRYRQIEREGGVLRDTRAHAQQTHVLSSKTEHRGCTCKTA
jgi:hypothetical protein